MKEKVVLWLYPFLGAAIIGLHFSPFVASSALVLLLFFSLFYLKEAVATTPWWLWVLPLLVLWQVLAQMASGWQPGFADKLMLRLPLLFLPLLFVWAKDSQAQKFKLPVLVGINLFHVWIGVASVLNYLAHYRFYNQMILESKPIPLFSQVYHIEFSMMMAVFALFGLYERRRRGHLMSDALFVLSLVNVSLVFFISVRTGMLCVIFGVGIKWLVDITKNKSGIWIFPAIMLVVVLMFVLMPGLRNRLLNTVEDVKTIVTGGDVRDKSLGRRWVAWDAALKASGQAPLTGYGMKGVEAAMDKGYNNQKKQTDLNNRVMPHNQFLDLLLQSGWPAVILMLLFVVGAFVFLLKSNNSAGLAVWAALLVAAFFESYLERQAGVLVFAASWLLMDKTKKTEIND